LTIKYGVFEQTSHIEKVMWSLCVNSFGVLEIGTIHTNTCWKSFTPLVDSHVDNVLVEIAPELSQPLF